VRISPNLHWHNLPLKALLRKKLKYPITVDNDATESGPAEGYSYEATPAEISARLASLRAGVARHEQDSAERGSRAR